MARLSVSRKLITGFIVVALFGLLIGVFALVQTNSLGESVVRLNELNIPQIQYLELLKIEQMSVRIALDEMRNPVYDRKHYDQTFVDFAEARARFRDSLEKFSRLDLCQPERDFLVQLNADFANVIKVNDQLISYGKAHADDEDVHQKLYELAVSIGQIEAFDKLMNTIQAMLEHAKTDNDDVKRQSDEVVETGRLVVLATGASAFVISLVFGVLLAIAITRRVRQATGVIETSADYIGSSTEQLAMASQSLASGSSEQAASIEEISSSLEEISSMIKQNADYAGQADKLTADAIASISEAHQAMQKSLTASQEIAHSSSETQNIIKTIDEIAFQTNLLSLNAAVEAARAGEAGAGFAVVADEVRSLSMRSAEASRRTAELIEQTISKTKEGLEIFTETGKSMDEVVERSSKVKQLVGEIAVASDEQARGIEQINKGVSEMEKVVQQNAANSEETAASTEELNAQTEEMRFSVDSLTAYILGRGRLARRLERRDQLKASPPPANPPAVKPSHAPASEKRTSPRPGAPEQLIPLDEEDLKDF